jgi:hypothetical protein
MTNERTSLPLSGGSRRRQPPRWLTWAAALIAAELLIAAAYFLRPGASPLAVGAALAALGALAWWMTLRLLDAPLVTPAVRIDAGRLPRLARAFALISGGGALALVVVWSAAGAAAPSTLVQMLIWAVGIGVVALGVGALPVRFGVPARWELLALAGIVALALLLRAWDVGGLVRGLIDEVIYINGVLRLHDAPQTGLLTSLSRLAPTTAVYTTWNAAAVELFGQTLAGLRLTNVILGTLGVAALYGLARQLAGARVALAAALILATFPPHLHFSRIATPQLADALFGTLALWCAVRAWHGGGASDWARAGVCLGLTQYFYEGGRLLFPALMLAFVGWLWLSERQARGRITRGIGRGLLAFALVGAPVYLSIALSGTSPTRRLDDVGMSTAQWETIFAGGFSLEALRLLAERFAQPFLVYVHQPDITGEFYGGDQPMILVVLVPLLLAGTVWATRCALRRGRALLLPVLWASAAALGNGLLVVTAVYPRYIDAYPALALLLALGLVGLADVFGRWHARALLIGVMLVGSVQGFYYVGVHLPLFNVQFRAAKPYPDGVDAVLRAVESLPPDTALYLISSPPDNRTALRRLLRFLTLNDAPPLLGASPTMTLETLDADSLTPDAVRALPRVNSAFFVAPGAGDAVALLGRYFPLQRPQVSPYDLPAEEAYVLYFAPSR